MLALPLVSRVILVVAVAFPIIQYCQQQQQQQNLIRINPPKEESISYILLAVSGTLEEGFELRENLDYRPTTMVPLLSNNHQQHQQQHQQQQQQRRVNATLLGKGLVRGYKSFLDIKTPNAREYKYKTSQKKTVNPAILPTGCDEHANRYSIYAVDSRQALMALAGEPRFLSIAPDMGLVSLTTAAGGSTTKKEDDYTSPDIQALSRAYIAKSNNNNKDDTPPKNTDKIAFLTVTSTWFQSTFVESPIWKELLVVEEDTSSGGGGGDGGNKGMSSLSYVTDYAESVALWSRSVLNPTSNNSNNSNETILLKQHPIYPDGCGPHPTGGGGTANIHTSTDYQTCIDAAIRNQEDLYSYTEGSDGEKAVQGEFVGFEQCLSNTDSTESNTNDDDSNEFNNRGTKDCFVCERQAQYGTDKFTARFNQIMTACELEELMVQAGVVDPNRKDSPKYPLAGCSLLEREEFQNGGSIEDIKTSMTDPVFLAFAMGLFIGIVLSFQTTPTTRIEVSRAKMD